MLTPRVIGFTATVLLLGVVIALASLRGEPTHRKAFPVEEVHLNAVEPDHLAHLLITGRRDLVVFDMRTGEVDLEAAPPVRSAIRCAGCHATAEEGRAFLDGLPASVQLSKRLAFYTETGTEDVSFPAHIRDNPFVCGLAGGYQAWEDDVLAEVTYSAQDDTRAREDKARRRAVGAFFRGEKLTADDAPPPVAAPPPVRRAPVAQVADEGC
jgi:hypothetical protein